jgi:two-component system CheB/CheR fusion protein
MFALLLESQGAEVKAALSSTQALELSEPPFDLIFSDISMPGMDGYELIERLRQRPLHARTPAVALTGFGRPEDGVRSRQAGFTQHMTRPIDFDEVVRIAQRFARTP